MVGVTGFVRAPCEPVADLGRVHGCGPGLREEGATGGIGPRPVARLDDQPVGITNGGNRGLTTMRAGVG